MVMDVLSYGIGTLVGFAAIIGLVFVFISDITQKKHGVLRNYPVVGRLRYFFEELGEYFRHKGVTFSAVLSGTLRRQQQTYAAIREGFGDSAADTSASVAVPLLWPGLNEFDSEAVIATVHPHKLEKPDTPERYRYHFRLLRDGLTQWMNGVVNPKGMPSYLEFNLGVTSALDHIRKNCDG